MKETTDWFRAAIHQRIKKISWRIKLLKKVVLTKSKLRIYYKEEILQKYFPKALKVPRNQY